MTRNTATVGDVTANYIDLWNGLDDIIYFNISKVANGYIVQLGMMTQKYVFENFKDMKAFVLKEMERFNDDK